LTCYREMWRTLTEKTTNPLHYASFHVDESIFGDYQPQSTKNREI